MKEIYTSYYNKVDKIKEKCEGFDLVSISTSIPEFASDISVNCKALAPGWDLVSPYKNMIKDGGSEKSAWDIYVEGYNEKVLSKIDCNKLYDLLPDKCVLLCYEGRDKNCHRHLVAQWLNENIEGLSVKELNI